MAWQRLLLILQTSGKTSADEWETSADEWRRMRDKCRWMRHKWQRWSTCEMVLDSWEPSHCWTYSLIECLKLRVSSLILGTLVPVLDNWPIWIKRLSWSSLFRQKVFLLTFCDIFYYRVKLSRTKVTKFCRGD